MSSRARKRDQLKDLALRPWRSRSRSSASERATHQTTKQSSIAPSAGTSDDRVTLSQDHFCAGSSLPDSGAVPELPNTSIQRVESRPFGGLAPPVPAAIIVSPEDGQPSFPINTACGAQTEDRPSNELAAGRVSTVSRDLWHKALAKLPNDEQAFIKEMQGDTRIENIFQALSESIVEKQRNANVRQWTISAFDRQFCVRDIMVKIVDCIQRFKEVGDIVVSFDPVHAALPWAGFRFLLQLATSEVEQTGMLLIMLEKVGPLVLRGEIYERIYLDPRVNIKADAKSSLKRTVVDLYSVVLSSMSVAGRLFSKGIARQGLHATTHPNTVKSLLDKLDEKGRDLGAEAQACEASRIESLHQDVSAELMHLQDILERPLARVDAYLENMWASAMSSERGAMLQWISPIAYDSDHDFARKNRLKGTAEWLLAREEYQEWKESNSSTIFWLHGIPGAGKTKLCSKVVDDCLSMNLDMDTDEGLAYFYCDRNREDHQDPDTILGSLVRQLSTRPGHRTGIVQAVYKTWTEQRSKGFPTKSLSIEKCKELLPALVGAYTQTIIIVDGLDECDQGTRYELMDVLDAAMNLPAALVKILIASRNDTDLVRQYGAGKHLQVKAAHNQGDIEKFVLSEMARSRNPLFREKMSDQLKAQILKTFRNKSRGMFQWAKLQIDELTSLMVESEVREYLQKLPEGLTRSYDNLLDRILGRKGRGPIIAIRAFLWIMGSWYPLTSEKLVAGVQQNPDTEGADPEDADLDIEVVLEACQNLIAITGSKDWESCRFSHLSVQEYLEQHLEERLRIHGFAARTARTHVAMVCLRVLTDPRLPTALEILLDENILTEDDILTEYDFRTGDSSLTHAQTSEPPPSRQFLKVYKSLRVVVEGWFIYVQDCDPESSAGEDEVAPLLQRFLARPQSSSHNYQAWMKINTSATDSRFDQRRPRAFDRVFCTNMCEPFECTALGIAYFGLSGVLRSWADRIDFNAVNVTAMNLLHLAASSGRREVCKLLLQRGVPVNALDNTGATPLMVAVRERQASVAELLLTEGQADPNLGRSKGYYKSQIETPLSMAIIKRMCHLVALFLAKGASPDEHAIAAALEWGGIAEVLRQLLEAGGHPPPSAIITAVDSALRDEIEVARILIDRERLDVNYVADQNSEFAGEGTALNAAVMRGKVKTVGLLLERGADANLAAGKYGTPLQRAARLGLYDFVPLLVAGGGDPNYVDDKYPCCPLYTAYEQLLQRRSKYLDHGDQERFMFLVDDVEVRLRLTIRELKKAGATLLRPQFEDAGNEVDFSAFLAVQQRYESELPIIDGSLNQASPIQYDSDLWSLPTRGTTGSQE